MYNRPRTGPTQESNLVTVASWYYGPQSNQQLHVVGSVNSPYSGSTGQFLGVALSVGGEGSQTTVDWSLELYATERNATSGACDTYNIDYGSESSRAQVNTAACSATQLTHMDRAPKDFPFYFHFTVMVNDQPLSSETVNLVLLGVQGPYDATDKSNQEFFYTQSVNISSAINLNQPHTAGLNQPTLLNPVSNAMCGCSGLSSSQQNFCTFVEAVSRNENRLFNKPYSWEARQQAVLEEQEGSWDDEDTAILAVVTCLVFILFIGGLLQKYADADAAPNLE